MPWGDPQILSQIVRRSRRHFDDPGLRRIAQRAAVQTGLVESGGRNLPGGDADSQGWRQERASLYPNPRNVGASIDRFFQEFKQHYSPGERSFEVAAQVQRPAAQYRGRYGEVRGEANRILKAARAGVPPGAGSGGRGGAPGGPVTIPGTAGAGSPPMGSEGLLSLLSALGEGKAPVPSAGLQGPAHSAGVALPEGYQLPMSGGGPAPKADIGALMEAVRTLGGDVAHGGMDPLTMSLPGGGGGAGGGGARARGGTNAEGLADEITQFAQQSLGLGGGSRDRSPGANAAVGGSSTSDHLEGGGVGRGKEAVDIPTTAAQGGWDQYRKVVRQLGLKPNSGGFTQGTIKRGKKRFRVQVIFGDQHNHGDHIHVGFRRA